MNHSLEVEKLTAATVGELYARLGAALLGESYGAAPEDDEEHRRFGRRWFDDRIDAIREMICGHAVTKELSGDFPNDILALAVLVLPLAGNNQALALTVAAIVVRRGVAQLCASADGTAGR